RTESGTGATNGYCTNAGACDRDMNGVTTGCSADSACIDDELGKFCRIKCNGDTGCRTGQACDDNGGDSTCKPLCNSDNDCQTTSAGAGIGCNLWSRRCELK